jgi:hypothetical protein
MLLRVTDEELLAKTGGIIQGMSGSPIIQNGKLFGAVTHVLVDRSDRRLRHFYRVDDKRFLRSTRLAKFCIYDVVFFKKKIGGKYVIFSCDC